MSEQEVTLAPTQEETREWFKTQAAEVLSRLAHPARLDLVDTGLTEEEANGILFAAVQELVEDGWDAFLAGLRATWADDQP